ncbi:hypothetical protein [Candidatus Neptunichlamydia sp. REUL1]|uniref:hypothetical protein n=1 Tax=Candidatus Neptunichlamydia sp. REUL1 TaxID=3064277 RepID=UPI002930EFEE|nr:hypothetical protein [Candidatus Neptunochlamydia sp. REUL1]
MKITLGNYLKNPLLDQVRSNYSELIQGQGFTHKDKTYLVKMIETSVDEKKALVIIARAADRVFGEIFYADKTSEFIKTTSHADCPPQLRTIITVGKRAEAEEVNYVGEELNARQQVLVDLFKKEEGISPPSTVGEELNEDQQVLVDLFKKEEEISPPSTVGEELNEDQQVLVGPFKKEEEISPPSTERYSRNQKAFALFVSVLFLSTTAYGANKVRKGDITLPTRKEIGDFLSKTKSNASDYLSQLRQKWMPQKGVKA